MSFTRRWRGKTKKEVSESMRVLALKRSGKMTKAQKVEHGKMMVKVREARKVI